MSNRYRNCEIVIKPSCGKRVISYGGSSQLEGKARGEGLNVKWDPQSRPLI